MPTELITLEHILERYREESKDIPGGLGKESFRWMDIQRYFIQTRILKESDITVTP